MAERPTIEPITVTIKGAAERLGCAPATVRRLCASGRMRHARIGGIIVIAPEWLKGIGPDDLLEPKPIARATRLKSPPPFIGDVVYFLEASSAHVIKIGWSRYVGGRIKNLRTGSPVPLRFLGCIAGGMNLERELHMKFAKYRKHGEWFRASVELRQFIDATLAEQGLPVHG